MARSLSLFVLAAAACGGAPAPAAPACPAGTTWNGTDCAAVIDTSCQPGMHFVSGRGCVAIVVAQPPPPPPPPAQPTPTPSDPSGVPQTVWIAHMVANLPPRVCAASYFQQCFVTTAAECETATRSLTQACIRDRRATLPRFFDRENGRVEGTKIGQCVGSAYELEMRGKGRFVNSAACNDPTRWK